MSVNELTRNSMAEAKEDHIGIIQFHAEAEVGLADEVAVYRCHRRTLGRSRGRCYNLDIRVVQQYSEKLASGISGASRNRYAYLIHRLNRLQSNRSSAGSR